MTAEIRERMFATKITWTPGEKLKTAIINWIISSFLPVSWTKHHWSLSRQEQRAVMENTNTDKLSFPAGVVDAAHVGQLQQVVIISFLLLFEICFSDDWTIKWKQWIWIVNMLRKPQKKKNTHTKIWCVWLYPGRTVSDDYYLISLQKGFQTNTRKWSKSKKLLLVQFVPQSSPQSHHAGRLNISNNI